MKNINIMYMGTPDFASYILEDLIDSGYNVKSVVTKVDAPKGRGQKIRFSAVKETALKRNITVYQPDTLKDGAFSDVLESEKPDMIIVAAYGKILPPYIISYPKYGCINVHASLLPKYRGSAPIQYAILKGEKVSGVTSMLMDNGLDTGDIMLQKSVDILECDNCGDLHDKLMVLGCDVIKETIENIENIKPVPQEDCLSCYAPPIKKEETIIDFCDTTNNIINKIRGFYPFPGTSFIFNKNSYKIHNAVVYSCKKPDTEAGNVIEFSKNGIFIATLDGVIKITELQPAGKKKMTVSDFYNGYREE